MNGPFAYIRDGDDSGRHGLPKQEFPASIHPLEDLAHMEWLIKHIRPIGRGSDRVHLWSIVPQGFPAYARILHPAYSGADDTPVRWASVAAEHGQVAHPLMKFERLLGRDDPTWDADPSMGQLPMEEASIIVSTLRHFTTTPDRCYLLVWDGYGGLVERSFPPSRKLNLPDRSYWAYVGNIDSVLELSDEGNILQGPNLWWPEDQAWVVATEIDFVDTHVGGSTECVSQLLDDFRLEAFPISIDARVDLLADTINT